MMIENYILNCLVRCGEQNKLLSNNIANVNTPSFKAKMVKETAVSGLSDLGEKRIDMFCTTSAHIGSPSSNDDVDIKCQAMNGEVKPNGNNVDLLQQVSALSRNYAKNDAALALFRSTFEFAHIACVGKV